MLTTVKVEYDGCVVAQWNSDDCRTPPVPRVGEFINVWAADGMVFNLQVVKIVSDAFLNSVTSVRRIIIWVVTEKA